MAQSCGQALVLQARLRSGCQPVGVDGTWEPAVAIVCDDRPRFRDAVVRLVRACGFEVPAVTEDFSAVEPLVQQHGARMAVVALPLTGMSGLLAAKAFTSAAPGCELVLVSHSDTLLDAALDAGARALVPESDLRVLRRVLLEVAAARTRLAPWSGSGGRQWQRQAEAVDVAEPATERLGQGTGDRQTQP